MSETRNLFHLQCAARIARNSTDHQIEWLLECEGDIHSSKTTIAFERKFFLPRKQALKIIDSINE